MVTKLERLIEVRNTVKVQLEAFRDQVQREVNDASLEVCESLLEQLIELRNEFKELHTQLLLLITDKADFPIQMQVKKEFDDLYFVVKAVISKQLKTFRTTCNNNDNVINDFSEDNNERSNASGKSNNMQSSFVKLPRIMLPVFNGKIDEWTSFCDLFLVTVHRNETLSDIQKFQYLVASLKDDALKVVRAISLKGENYNQAIEALESRYQNRQLLAQSHASVLIDVPQIKDNGYEELNRFVDDVRAHIRSLETLGHEVSDTDPVMMQLILRKLSDTLKNGWFAKSVSMQNPTRTRLLEYLDTAAIALRNNKQINDKPRNVKSHSNIFVNKKSNTETVTQGKQCYCCKSNEHIIFQCDQFKRLSADQRNELVRRCKLCLNCLRIGHKVSDCHASNCKHCNKKHSTWLHRNTEKVATLCREEVVNVSHAEPLKENINITNVSNNCSVASLKNSVRIDQCLNVNDKSSKSVLLATAIVFCLDSKNRKRKIRVLLDSGSMSNLITKDCVKRFGLIMKSVNIELRGISNVKCNVNQSCQFTLCSRFNNYQITSNALVLNEVTGTLPVLKLPSLQLPVDEGKMADALYHTPGSIDMILGAQNVIDCFSATPAIKLKEGPFIKETVFGYVLIGNYCEPDVCIANNILVSSCILSDIVQKFWQLEHVPDNNVHLSRDEEKCEMFYADTTARNEEGRFIVRLPFKRSPKLLGESRQIAIRILHHVMSRLDKTQLIMYNNFMNEYRLLGHMQEIEYDRSGEGFYLPHHAVFKEDSSTSKIRVVFNASRSSSTNVSLNDILYVGPTIQDDLFSILTRFRTYQYAVVADIAKMYRQILIHDEDAKYQRIVWMVNGKIKDFELKTVTYGTAPAAFLSIRSLHEIAKIEKDNYPLASSRIKDFYVDDLISGANTFDEARELITQMCEMLSKAKFSLRKWTSNCPTLINTSFCNANEQVEFLVDGKDQSMALGMIWNTRSDQLVLKITLSHMSNLINKRKILSEISSLFDPLGLAAPAIVRAKLLLRQLWQAKLDWDDIPSDIICKDWTLLRKQLTKLSIQVPRLVIVEKSKIEIHGFCDASERAYAACFYIKSHGNGNVIIQLLCAKTRIAPLKPLVIPRLELCAAHLLARLYLKVKSLFEFASNRTTTYFWSDSKIVLSWLAKEPNTWKQFVATRTAAILEITDFRCWHYVPSLQNPADIASRGLRPDLLADCNLWWHGPSFLKDNAYSVKENEYCDIDIVKSEAKKSKKRFLTHINMYSDFSIFDKFSDYDKLIHIVAYCLRFLNKCRRNFDFAFSDSINNFEVENALTRLVKIIQTQTYTGDIVKLKRKNCVSRKSSIAPLAPFLDENEVIRVGGRLHNAEINYGSRHPILLPVNHVFITLIIRKSHVSLCHAGIASVIAHIREKFWIPRLANRVRSVLKSCIICKKIKATTMQQIMAPLPPDRVKPTLPFAVTGVDLTGEFKIKPSKRNTRTTLKAYVIIYVCFAIKAVYVDVVSDRSSEAFLASFQRFTARRRRPKIMYSDHGTNFVGADKEWQCIIKSEKVKTACIDLDIQWKYIVPNAPHMGGLWESAVRSAKTHMKKVIGQTILTFEELSTLCTRVEACLNSRPLFASSNDPNDLNVITPGHFLTGRSLQIAPEVYDDQTKDLRNRWKLLQTMNVCFWKRWYRDYLHTLQCRYKWQKVYPEPKLGDLVLLKEETPTMKWKLARIIDLIERDNDFIRTVKVKTATGEYIRPIVKIVPLMQVKNEIASG